LHLDVNRGIINNTVINFNTEYFYVAIAITNWPSFFYYAKYIIILTQIGSKYQQTDLSFITSVKFKTLTLKR